ncbi:bifunctional methylenetetrahydrofolate dehydrogenase/methenyltetrahydrofolate cyclohydrolase FolD [Bacillaceae bacterium W0354]
MDATIMYGTELANKYREDFKIKVNELKQKGYQPSLAVIIVGNNPASETYVRMKQKACEKVGIHSVVKQFNENIDEVILLDYIEQLNKDESINGILVQLPLPKHINETLVLEKVDPAKDVDGFHPINVGKLSIGQDTLYPCTPFGIVKLLEHYQVEVEGKHVVIVGRSNIVGKPVGQLMLNQNATITYCHSKTKDLFAHTKRADILIVAVGKAKLITKEAVKENAVIIDVGNTFLKNGKVVGDVDFDQVKETASFITPVPKGVGPMTITMLLHNTIKATEYQLKRLS